MRGGMDRTTTRDEGSGGIIGSGPADVVRTQERYRRRRLAHLAMLLAPVAAWMWFRVLTTGSAAPPSPPAMDPMLMVMLLILLAMPLMMVGMWLVAGRSPHVTFRREQIDVRLDDVKGLAPVRAEVEQTLAVFRNAASFQREMGGTPRRGLLFDGPPGTGKTHMAKAMAAEAGVPFLFVSATSFQSMFYGATARKIRSYFKELRRAARAEGAAIGFIEEIDAIATARSGLGATAAPAGLVPSRAWGPGAGLRAQLSGGTSSGSVTHAAISEGVGGVVNELLVQMQSFDQPTGRQRAVALLVDAVNRYLPPHRQLSRPRPEPVNVLIIAATNRSSDLDPALLRPGRFDRRLTFGLPDKAGRREIIDHFLARKAHDDQLDEDEYRDALAGVTQGYSPVMIEHLLDEALVYALRRDAMSLSWADLAQARLSTEIGVGQPVGYTAHEKNLIATHEAGHAVMAWLVAPQRRLEILTIIKRGDALGMLSHGDREDVYTRSRSELESMIQIAFGGQVAEEIFFGDISTGPAGDLQYATTVAAQMVGAAGMSDTLISYSAVQGGPFNSDNLVGRVIGDSAGRRMVESTLSQAREEARMLLSLHRHLVAALRDALLERHELVGHEITDVLVAAGGARDRVIDLRSCAVGDAGA